MLAHYWVSVISALYPEGDYPFTQYTLINASMNSLAVTPICITLLEYGKLKAIRAK